MRWLGLIVLVDWFGNITIDGRATIGLVTPLLALPILVVLARRAPDDDAHRWLIVTPLAALLVWALRLTPWLTHGSWALPNALGAVAYCAGTAAYCFGLAAWFTAGGWDRASAQYRRVGLAFGLPGAVAVTAAITSLVVGADPGNDGWPTGPVAMTVLVLLWLCTAGALIYLSQVNTNIGRALRDADSLAPGIVPVAA